jgi:exoribonuclease R
MTTPQQTLESAFQRTRQELGIRTGFPPEVERAAEAAAGSPAWRSEARVDRTATPFVTIDPPGSRDLDQALFLERDGPGFRVHYAIADVAAFVARGGEVEREAWKRGVTYYAPDERAPLYPSVLSQGAASLLPGEPRPSVLFTIRLDATGEIADGGVERATVTSRRQLTYGEALRQVEGDGALFRGEPFADSLLLLKEIGELRAERERVRGGVSLPILDQHVEKGAARRMGYQLGYEEPNAAEDWNAQISLLTGHFAAERMLEAGVGLLRTMPPPRESDVVKLRVAARALGFDWPTALPYPAFIHSLEASAPRLPILLWQARHLMRGAGYEAFDGAPPPHPEHAALAMVYAHATAPLRRLADRYVLDLLVELQGAKRPPPEEVATLAALPPVMNGADRRAATLERKVVDSAEAWELRGRAGEVFPALVLDQGGRWLEAQLVDVPVRARVPIAATAPPAALGARVRLRLLSVDLAAAECRFEMAE